jgi:hypothetical protein
MAAEVATYRAHLAKRVETDSSGERTFAAHETSNEEGEPPVVSIDSSAAANRGQRDSTTLALVNPVLLKWFRAHNLSSVANIVCAGLGLHSTQDLTTVTPDALSKLASANANHPQLNPLRLRRLKDALVLLHDKTSSAARDWDDWSPPPAFGPRGTDALAALGLKKSMRDRAVSGNTRQILARNTLSRAEVERISREERAKLEHARSQWCKRGEETGKTAHNAAVSGRRNLETRHDAGEVTHHCLQ